MSEPRRPPPRAPAPPRSARRRGSPRGRTSWSWSRAGRLPVEMTRSPSSIPSCSAPHDPIRMNVGCSLSARISAMHDLDVVGADPGRQRTRRAGPCTCRSRSRTRDGGASARRRRSGRRPARRGPGRRGGGCSRPAHPGQGRCGTAARRWGLRRGHPRVGKGSLLVRARSIERAPPIEHRGPIPRASSRSAHVRPVHGPCSAHVRAALGAGRGSRTGPDRAGGGAAIGRRTGARDPGPVGPMRGSGGSHGRLPPKEPRLQRVGRHGRHRLRRDAVPAERRPRRRRHGRSPRAGRRSAAGARVAPGGGAPASRRSTAP